MPEKLIANSTSSIIIEANSVIPPAFFLEKQFNWLMSKQINISAIVLGLLLIPITLDVLVRFFLDSSLIGITELETNSLVLLGFIAVGFATVGKQHIQIDLFFNSFSKPLQKRIHLFTLVASLICMSIMTYFCFISGYETEETSATLRLPNKYFIFVTAYGFLTMCIAIVYQLLHLIKAMYKEKDYLSLLIGILLPIILISLPFIYKAYGVKVSTLLLGLIGFILLFVLLMIRFPLGIAMMFIGIIGLLATMRSPMAVQGALGELPFRQTSEFIFLAMPMFMLMGEMITMSGMSKDLFDCANKWLNRLPGGLAVASVGGCAGFGAVCGDSMATVLTMSSVALPPMREKNYDLSLATGALAAGGTLGILIPPSMGFIVYSMMTQESVGKLFMAGILPGILLAFIFMSIIIIKVKLNPSLAVADAPYSLKEKLLSCKGLIPIIGLFIIVVGGILSGQFTPGEGGAVGAACAIIIAGIRRKINLKSFSKALYNTARMCGVIFVLLVGVFSFGVFLTTSNLPTLLADFIINLDVNRYLILFVVVLIYIFLGCVMNITPMMMLTLPSIFPTIQGLGFDGIWFGVLTVIIMEMGLITPPIGLNVFTLASANPDIPLATVFRGVFPFFLGMCLCALLIVIFPQIALYLPSLM